MNQKLVLAAELKNLGSFQEYVRQAAVSCGLEAKHLNQIELALEEILVNVIRYAYPADQQGNIELTCSAVSQEGLTIKVVDQGIAFDPLARPDPDTSLSLEERDIGGLGIFMTKTLMSELNYERRQGKNILTMSKRHSD